MAYHSRHTSRIAACGLIVLMLSSWLHSVEGAVTSVRGCEAADMLHSLPSTGEADWSAVAVELGDWRVAHVVKLVCVDAVCEGTGGLSPVLEPAAAPTPGWPDPDPPTAREALGSVALPNPGRALYEQRSITGPSASTLARSIAGRAYRGDDGRDHVVWVDYGRLAASVRVRGRTEAACTADGAACTIETTVLFFVDYDEFHPCGYLSPLRGDGPHRLGALQPPATGPE